MNNPAQETPKVFTLIYSALPEVQRDAVERFYTPQAGWKHPAVQVNPGPGSRDKILKLYQWLRIISPKTNRTVNDIVYDKYRNIVFLDVTQEFNLFNLPFWIGSSQMVTRLTLEKDSDKFRIALQEDLMHPDDAFGLFLPPLRAFVQMGLLWIAMVLCTLTRIAEILGVISVKKGENGGQEERGEAKPKMRNNQKRRRNRKNNDASSATGSSASQNGHRKSPGTPKPDDEESEREGDEQSQ